MWITAILALSLMACSQEPASPDKEDKLRVGYITMDMTSPYFINMIDGMKEKAKELDIDLSIHDGKYEVEPQIQAMETLITQKVDAIIISVNDPVALQPMVDKAKEVAVLTFTQVPIVLERVKGLDAVDEALIKIKEGGIYRGTVDIAPFESGKIIIESTKKGY